MHQVHAAKQDDTSTYTQIFQNPTTTLSGKSVQADLTFSKMDYWDVKKATLSLNFQISQLAARDTSDITLAVNGVKFESFRPAKETGLQTKQVEIPVNLLQGSNTLTVSGQILNKVGKSYNVDQTPANWLTIYSGANVNFQYTIKQADSSVKSFYAHFTGMDTVQNHQSAIVVPDAATDSELTAASTALSGVARFITTTDTKLPIVRAGSDAQKGAQYQLVVARYDRLPDDLEKQVSAAEVTHQAVLKTYTKDNTHYLIVTARSNAALKKAAKFVANQELMQETSASTEPVTPATQTDTSVLQYQGSRQLTTSNTTLTGPGHQSASYFVTLPTDRTNADGSTITLHLKYAKNLDFKNSLVTVSVNGEKIGSKRLAAARADSDTVTVKLPRGEALGDAFTISVSFDLATVNASKSDQTPWAMVMSSSKAYIKSQPKADLLFSNFPTTFVKNDAFDNLIVVRPKTMTDDDYSTLTNLFNLFGNYVQQNTGRLRIVTKTPRKTALSNASVVAFGTPKQNALIDKLNGKLYFQYTKDRSGFLSNEKLSIEKEYGKTIGTDQLLRSPYNDKRGLLVVTGATPNATLLASTQISTQATVAQYKGDAIVVDPDNVHYSYRFKKVAAVQERESTKQVITNNAKIIIYLVIVAMVFILILLALFLIVRKNRQRPSEHQATSHVRKGHSHE
jgi:ribosomal protein S11